jgi:hydrogenase expression/formation protein HypC
MCLGVPGQLEEVFEEDGLFMGKVRFSGVARTICLELIPGVASGDYVLVHVGFALCRLDPAEAERLTGLLSELETTSPEGAESRLTP